MEAKQENPQKEIKEKWEAKATQKLNGISAKQVWNLLEDFCNFHKWLPTIDTCDYVEGLKGQTGLIRYCASTTTTTSSQLLDHESKKIIIKWCHEKLLAIDHVDRCMSYEVLDNNMGLNYYVSTIKVVELENGCEIEWGFVADPVEGLTCEDLSGYLGFALKGVAENMAKALC